MHGEYAAAEGIFRPKVLLKGNLLCSASCRRTLVVLRAENPLMIQNILRV